MALNKSAVTLGALLFGAALTLVWSGDAEARRDGERWARGRILVKAKDGTALPEFERVLKRHLAKRSGKRVHGSGAEVIELPLGVSESTAADLLSRDAAVEFAEVDRLVEPDIVANDPYFASAWHLPKIRATDAWATSTGAGVTIAIIDSGVDAAHPDLAPLMVAGWNFYDGNANTADVYGHGTKVAGAAAARSNNGIGIAAVSWQSKIMPLRVSLPDGTAYLSAIASAITWAADHGARVANVSFQSAAGSPTVQNAAKYMKSKGGMVVASSGNTSGLQSFAANDSVIAVGATASNDTRASFSSWGPYVDLTAPGVGIYTTVKGGGYGGASGTSFASPITAGVIALMMSRNPSATPAQIEAALKSTAVDLGSAGRDDYFGEGRIDAAAAVAAIGGTTPPPPPPTGGGGGTATSLSITFPSASTQPSVSAGATLMVNWSGIGTPSATDWIGLHVPSNASSTIVEWMYVSCTKAASAARASGSCAFVLPKTMAAGTYELRMHSANTYTVLAKSSGFSVTIATTTGGNTVGLSLSSSSVARGGSVTVSWSGISAPTPRDWVGLHVAGAASTSFVDWVYVNCSKVATTASASGSCAFAVPASVAPGAYEFRLHTNNGYTVLARTSATVQ